MSDKTHLQLDIPDDAEVKLGLLFFLEMRPEVKEILAEDDDFDPAQYPTQLALFPNILSLKQFMLELAERGDGLELFHTGFYPIIFDVPSEDPNYVVYGVMDRRHKVGEGTVLEEFATREQAAKHVTENYSIDEIARYVDVMPFVKTQIKPEHLEEYFGSEAADLVDKVRVKPHDGE